MLPEWTLFHLLQNAAERAPDKVAVVDDDKTSHTYGELQQASARLAHALRAHGLKRGDRVGVYVEKSFEALAAMTACAHAGGVFVNINPLLKAAQVAHIMKNCGARQLIVDGEKLSGELPAVDVVYLRGKAPPTPAIAADCERGCLRRGSLADNDERVLGLPVPTGSVEVGLRIDRRREGIRGIRASRVGRHPCSALRDLTDCRFEAPLLLPLLLECDHLNVASAQSAASAEKFVGSERLESLRHPDRGTRSLRDNHFE